MKTFSGSLSLEEGYLKILCCLFSEQLVGQAVHFGEVGLAHIGFGDAAVFVHQKGGGGGDDLVGLLSVTLCVVEHDEGQAVGLGVGLHYGQGVARHGDGNGDDLEVFALVVLVHPDEFGHFGYAAGAGGKPEVDEGNFALQGGLIHVLTLQVWQGEGGGALAFGGEQDVAGGGEHGQQEEGAEVFFHEAGSAGLDGIWAAMACCSSAGKRMARPVVWSMSMKLTRASARMRGLPVLRMV